MVSHPERPEHGARFTFDRVTVDEARAEYRVSIAVADHEFVGTAILQRSDGAMELTAWSPSIPDAVWIVDTARAFLRTLYANHKDDDASAWPRRVRRWRTSRTQD